jgi:hypothetical protein
MLRADLLFPKFDTTVLTNNSLASDFYLLSENSIIKSSHQLNLVNRLKVSFEKGFSRLRTHLHICTYITRPARLQLAIGDHMLWPPAEMSSFAQAVSLSVPGRVKLTA